VKRGAFVRRFSILAGVLGALICAATPARAQSTLGTAGAIGTTTPTTLVAADFFIGVQSTPGTNLNSFQLPRFFNQQNCNCDTPIYIYVTLEQSGFAKRSGLVQGNAGKFQIWAGPSLCDQPIYQGGRCTKLLEMPFTTFLADGHVTTPAVSSRVVSTDTTSLETVTDAGVIGTTTTASGAPTPNPTCTDATGTFQQTIWALVDIDGDGVYDVSPSPVTTVQVDLAPPPAPTNVVVRPGDEAVTLTWTPDDYSTNIDLQGYQVLCQRAGGLQVFPTNTFGAYYETCPKTRTGTGIVSLDPAFACSPLLTSTASSYRVKILQNNITYAAAVVAIDNSGNASPPVLIGPDYQGGSFEMPLKTDSFYDVYRNGENSNAGPVTPAPGAASGGLCAIANDDVPRGGHKKTRLGVGIGVSVLLAASLARARRRRRR
jgi:hypothetical protein